MLVSRIRRALGNPALIRTGPGGYSLTAGHDLLGGFRGFWEVYRLSPVPDDERTVLDRFVRPTLRNWNGIEVGGLRPGDALL